MASKRKSKPAFGVYLAAVKKVTARYSPLPPEIKEVLDHYEHNISAIRCATSIVQYGAFGHTLNL